MLNHSSNTIKEYVVIAKSEPDIDSVHHDLVTPTIASLNVNKDTIPSRPVEVANERLGNPIMTHYYLTDQEAQALANDNRIDCVHPAPTVDLKRKFVLQRSIAYNGTVGNFNRNSVNDKFNINWGLRRTSVSNIEPRPGNTYNYQNNGSGVDIIIVDDGIQIDHPEFLDPSGISRVQRVNWYAVTGIPGSMPPNHYNLNNIGDGEHGTHVATIAAGKTFGYAKNARIFSIRIFGDHSQTIPDNDIFDIIRIWHNKKPNDPLTKQKRPTVVNLSWGYAWYYKNNSFTNSPSMTSVSYRNNLTNFPNPVDPMTQFGQKISQGAAHGLIIPSIDYAQQLAEDAGVIFVHAAGNFGNKVDKLNGIDYNNYYTINQTFAGFIPPGNPIYYHRGCSPQSKNSINVSAAKDSLGYKNKNVPQELVDSYSERGPGCEVVAPGTNITAGTSKTASYYANEYVWGNRTPSHRSHKTVKLSGTSMATPQVTGVVALYLGKNPHASPEEVKTWIASMGYKNQILSSNSTDDWSNPNALLGGPNNYLCNPYNIVSTRKK